MDGLVYGVTVSLGFATYENYTYVYEWAVAIAKEETEKKLLIDVLKPLPNIMNIINYDL